MISENEQDHRHSIKIDINWSYIMVPKNMGLIKPSILKLYAVPQRLEFEGKQVIKLKLAKSLSYYR